MGLKGSLAYNFTGERIVLVGDRNAPDIVEDDRGQLDATLKYDFIAYNQDLQIELKARNILDENVKWTQGGQIYEDYKPGITYSLGLSIRF